MRKKRHKLEPRSQNVESKDHRLRRLNIAKKNFNTEDPMNKTNYQPVTILPAMSKVFEKSVGPQLTAHFEAIFSGSLTAYWKQHSCLSTLLRLTFTRKALDLHVWHWFEKLKTVSKLFKEQNAMCRTWKHLFKSREFDIGCASGIHFGPSPI